MRDHLLESRDRHLRDGRTSAEAEHTALTALGPLASLARAFLLQRGRARARRLLPVALALGLAFAWIDGRPTWDDTGVSAAAVLASSALFGVLGPAHPWMWAGAVGGWFPLLALFQQRGPGAALALVFACAGAHGGRLALYAWRESVAAL